MPTKLNTIYVLHEYGAPEHYLGLEHYAKQQHKSVRHITFTFVKPFLKALRSKSMSGLLTAVKNGLFVLLAWLFPSRLKDCDLVIGCAPLDWRMVLLLRLSEKANVIYHSSWGDWSGGKFPKVSRFGATVIDRKWRCFLQERVAKFALVTPQIGQQLNQYYQVPLKLCHTVYHSFDNALFCPNKRCEQASKRVLFVGRFVEEKGLDRVLELARQLPDYEFLLVGRGRLVTDVLQQAKSLENVQYLGYITDRVAMADLYRSVDFILQPSRKVDDWEELFGIALIEAMACGVIPFATKHIGPVTILSHSEMSAHLYEESDFVSAVYHDIVGLSAHPELLASRKQQAIDVAEKYSCRSIAFSWQSVFERN